MRACKKLAIETIRMLVSIQRIIIIGAVTLGNFSCNLSRKFVATQVERCDTGCLLESCYTGQRFYVILEAVVSSAAIMSWNKTSRAQKEQFDSPMSLNVATQVAGKVLHCATRGKNSLQRCETRCGK